MKNRWSLITALSLGLLGASLLGQERSVSLEDVWKGYRFYAQSSSGLRSMNDGEHYTVLSRQKGVPAILKFSYADGDFVETVLSAQTIAETSGKRLFFDSYQFSPQEDKLLLATQTEAIYRHSSQSYYYIYDLKTGSLDSLRVAGKQQLAQFSPTENKVAFVYDNHLHVQDLDQDNRIISMGKGEKNAFIAGAVDWVYEEEFSFHQGYQWSPGGDYLAYYQFDEREVPLFSMDVYGQGLYPQQEVFKYPKAGELNSKVAIHIYDLRQEKDLLVELPEAYEYIPRIQWNSDDDELVITSLNRHQNELNLWEVEVEDEELEVEKLLHEQAECYIEIDDDLHFLPDESFIWTSEKDGYKHLYHYSEEGKLKRQITKGPWEVTEFYGIDEEGYLYYQSAEESPLQRAVYRINLKGKKKQKLSSAVGWNEASFSQGMKYFINRYSNSSTPNQEGIYRADGQLMREITDNAELQQRLGNYRLSEKEFFDFESETGQRLNGWMIKPLDFDPNKEYPLLMFVYGGPGSQTVQDKYDGFNHFWYQSLAAEGYVIVSVDNRGTGARGRDFRTATYQQLGKYETEDQIAAARYLGRQSYIDSSRIGIWGWSYGGYMSSLALSKGADYFKMAIAVAPVTNWRFYDNIYTERYMRTPQENAEGYDDNSPINHVDKIKGAYLLVHGSADDNVHVQNTMRMTEALVQADVQFDLFIYPDRNHGIFGGNTRYHLYRKMTEFIKSQL